MSEHIGIHAIDPAIGKSSAREWGRIGGKKGGKPAAQEGMEVHGVDQATGERHSVRGGRKVTALGKGIHGINPDTGERYQVEEGRKGGAATVEKQVGIHNPGRRKSKK